MRFKFIESLEDNILYFNTEKEFKPPFEYEEEGIHFDMTAEEAEAIKDELRDKKYLYSIEVDKLNPLFIDGDLLLWSSENLADLFLHKLDNKVYESPFVINPRDITPEQVHIDIKEDDREILTTIFNLPVSSNSFLSIMNFIKNKGFDSILYTLYEGGYRYKAIILPQNYNFKYDSVTLIKEY